MAGFFENFASDVAAGFVENPNLRDARHAEKTFRTAGYGYAPKFKFLFHVYFELNSDYIPFLAQLPEDKNFGLAVKTVQLPKYSFDVHTMNQYNRKRMVQTKIKYDPINVTFHDDNANLIRKLWYNYYSYYYKDSVQQDPLSGIRTGAFNSNVSDLNARNIYQPDFSNSGDWGYIGETSIPQTPIAGSIGVVKAPFFRAINVYGFNQHSFVLYRLINPIIESFTHDTYDYSQGQGIMEHQMTLQYETVKYYDGALDGKKPEEFVKQFGNDDHYDRVLSPITRPGSQSNILGPGGLVSAAGGIMDDVASGNYLGALQKAAVAKNTFKNVQNITKIAKQEIIRETANAVKGDPNRNVNYKFPAMK